MAIDQEDKTLRFEASARLQRLFGRELIPDDDSAVEELVKNAYDSNASEVTIAIVRPTGASKGAIEIRDNGMGLSLRDFSRVWMMAGYSEKSGQPLPETARIQVGEKGIGRFAADKLGRRLTVFTKTRGAREALKVTFDWPRFEKGKRLLSDVPIPYEFVQEPLLPKHGSGTILRIEDLRSDWSDKAIEELRNRLSRLLNPYDTEQKFSIDLRAPTRKLSGVVIPGQIVGADFEWEINRSDQGRTRIKRRRPVLGGDELRWGEWETIPVTKVQKLGDMQEFGPVSARFFFFVGRPKKKNTNGAASGVAIFRDGIRVEPAGSSSSDWLGLLEKRAKRSGHMPLVPSRLFGFVRISRADNPEIQDATNRRAFVHGPQLDAFREFLKLRLEEFESQVEEEVAKPKWERSRQLKSQSLLQARYKTVSVMSLGLAHELRQPLQAIQAASENITGHLHAANIRIAEVDLAADVIERSVERIEGHIQFLKSLGTGSQEKEKFRVSGVVEEVIGVFKPFAAARNVKLVADAISKIDVETNRGTVLSTLTNLVLNAVEAIEGQGDGKSHEIRVSTESNSAHLRIKVRDDGPGVPESNRARLFKRMTTTKQGGMGIGLFVWRDALQMFGSDLECESFANPTIFTISIPM